MKEGVRAGDGAEAFEDGLRIGLDLFFKEERVEKGLRDSAAVIAKRRLSHDPRW